MNGFISFIVNDFLTQPVILIGLLICIGYIMNKESITKVITGTLSAMVSIQMVIFGGGQFTSIFKPITTAVSNSFGIQGYIMDSYAMKATTQEALGSLFGLVGYVFLIAFAVNLVLVYFFILAVSQKQSVSSLQVMPVLRIHKLFYGSF